MNEMPQLIHTQRNETIWSHCYLLKGQIWKGILVAYSQLNPCGWDICPIKKNTQRHKETSPLRIWPGLYWHFPGTEGRKKFGNQQQRESYKRNQGLSFGIPRGGKVQGLICWWGGRAASCITMRKAHSASVQHHDVTFLLPSLSDTASCCQPEPSIRKPHRYSVKEREDVMCYKNTPSRDLKMKMFYSRGCVLPLRSQEDKSCSSLSRKSQDHFRAGSGCSGFWKKAKGALQSWQLPQTCWQPWEQFQPMAQPGASIPEELWAWRLLPCLAGDTVRYLPQVRLQTALRRKAQLILGL